MFCYHCICSYVYDGAMECIDYGCCTATQTVNDNFNLYLPRLIAQRDWNQELVVFCSAFFSFVSSGRSMSECSSNTTSLIVNLYRCYCSCKLSIKSSTDDPNQQIWLKIARKRGLENLGKHTLQFFGLSKASGRSCISKVIAASLRS